MNILVKEDSWWRYIDNVSHPRLAGAISPFFIMLGDEVDNFIIRLEAGSELMEKYRNGSIDYLQLIPALQMLGLRTITVAGDLMIAVDTDEEEKLQN